MNRTRVLKNATRLALGLACLALAATPSFAQTTVDLCATTGSVTMPDATVVPIWGYVDITGGGDCTTAVATLPGPEIRATAGETLTVNLTNNLAENVSFFVPGLRPDTAPATAGTFTAEVAASTTGTYTFTPSAGSFLYHSATDRIRTQVPMGLYGALVVDVAAGQAYGDVSYAQDEVLVFSEIDPDLNADPAGMDGAKVVNWDPQYFLINGAAYDAANPDIAINVSEDVLLRFVNAGLETFFPTLGGGLYMDLKAEDGNRYPHPIQQYGLELQAGKTIDAVVNVGTAGRYALYDRAGHLTSAASTGGGMLAYFQAGTVAGAPVAADDAYATDEDTLLNAAAPGVLGNDTPGEAGPMSASLVSDVSGGSLTLNGDGSFDYTPNPDFNGVDQFTYVANGFTSTPIASSAHGTVQDLPRGGDPENVFDTIVELFNNTAYDYEERAIMEFDISGVPSAVAQATLELSVLYPTGPFPVTIEVFGYAGDGVLGLDDFSNGSLVTTVELPSSMDVSVDVTTFINDLVTLGENFAAFSLRTPPLDLGPVGSYILLMKDGSPVQELRLSTEPIVTSNVAAVTITVNPVNDPPVAVDDAYDAVVGQLLSVALPGVLGNDSDVDGDPLTAVLDTDVTSGTLVLNADGSFDYTPNVAAVPGDTDSFTYFANDGTVNSTAPATVTITVVAAPVVGPTAFDDSADMTGYKGNETPTSVNIPVLANDDLGSSPSTAVVSITTGGSSQRGGTVTLEPDNTVTFVPKKGFRGTDTFQYQVTTDVDTSNVATVVVNVN